MIGGVGLGAALAIAGALVSLALVALTFNPWFAIAIDVATVVIVLA